MGYCSMIRLNSLSPFGHGTVFISGRSNPVVREVRDPVSLGPSFPHIMKENITEDGWLTTSARSKETRKFIINFELHEGL